MSPSVDFGPGLPVLVVDDDALTRTLMKRMLTRLGCKVSTAVNGEAALELILSAPGETPASDQSPSAGPILERKSTFGEEESKYAITFLDNQMPVMSGLKAVAALRQLGRKDFVVGVTGNALLTDQQEYLEAGADYVLTKPVLERSLKSMLVLAEERRNSPPRTPPVS
jgi:CheY-like chemotaxis protein